MNKLTIIGNLTKAPELRTTQSGVSVCNFTVAVNRRHTVNNQPEADFFRVTAWRELAENCAKYLDKGKKVAVIGPVYMSTYTTQNGENRSILEVNALEVEFLSKKGEGQQNDAQKPKEAVSNGNTQGYSEVFDDDLPF